MRRADPSVSPEELTRWAELADLLVKEVKQVGIGTLVRIAHPGLPSDEKAENAFIASVRKKELSFKLRGNENVAAILAGFALVEIILSKKLEGLAAALAVRALRFSKSLPTFTELDEVANTRILETERAARARLEISRITSKDFANTAKTIEAGTADPAILRTAIEQLQKSTAMQVDVNERLATQLRIRDEELDLLWWAVGGSSFLQHRAFSSVPTLERPLLCAYELSARVAILPEPLSSDGLLRRALGAADADTSTRVGDVVTATPVEWLRKAFAPTGDGFTAVLPIHSLVNGMTGPVNATSVRDAELSTTLLEIARQALFELVALRALKGS